MDELHIKGGIALDGRINISGAKNAALPILCTTLLSDAPVTLRQIPILSDISSMSQLLIALGVRVEVHGDESAKKAGKGGRVMTLDSTNLDCFEAPYDMVRKMRASVLVLAPLVARMGQAKVSMPGGCAIGTRPIDLHILALQALGAKIDILSGYISAEAPNGLHGGEIKFPYPSVGATESALMAATLARGESVIRNGAREPEVLDLIAVLRQMGAQIALNDNNSISIQGTHALKSVDHTIIPDRIEAGSYMMAALATNGNVVLEGICGDLLTEPIRVLQAAGADIETGAGDTITIKSSDTPLRPMSISTAPYPGFPTDLQAQHMALCATIPGKSEIDETVFENRMMHVPELIRLGAMISTQGNRATIDGAKSRLVGAPVMATDLRASVSLVIAALAARGTSTISRIYHLDRGYDSLEQKLIRCGANIARVPSA